MDRQEVVERPLVVDELVDIFLMMRGNGCFLDSFKVVDSREEFNKLFEVSLEHLELRELRFLVLEDKGDEVLDELSLVGSIHSEDDIESHLFDSGGVAIGSPKGSMGGERRVVAPGDVGIELLGGFVVVVERHVVW